MGTLFLQYLIICYFEEDNKYKGRFISTKLGLHLIVDTYHGEEAIAMYTVISFQLGQLL